MSHTWCSFLLRAKGYPNRDDVLPKSRVSIPLNSTSILPLLPTSSLTKTFLSKYFLQITKILTRQAKNFVSYYSEIVVYFATTQKQHKDYEGSGNGYFDSLFLCSTVDELTNFLTNFCSGNFRGTKVS